MEAKHHQTFEFSKVTDNIYLGTNLCCLHKPHIQILLDLDITVEIDLEKERQDKAPDVPVYMWLPVEDKTAPDEEQLTAAVSLIDNTTKRGKRVYVHCRLGHGRSPTVVAAYFISQGQTVSEAIDFVAEKRPEIHIENTQRKALEEYYKRINK